MAFSTLRTVTLRNIPKYTPPTITPITFPSTTRTFPLNKPNLVALTLSSLLSLPTLKTPSTLIPHTHYRTYITPYNRNNEEHYETYTTAQIEKSNKKLIAMLILASVLASITVANAEESKVDYEAVRKDIEALLEDPNYDDGSFGPVFIRLAWHAAGTYDKVSKTGGSDGSTMRFDPEASHGANAGLAIARKKLEAVKQKHPNITYADLWSLAGVVAIESMGGPKITWRPGRSDKDHGGHCTPDGRLPDASKGPDHIRDIFGRMGFTDREIVALVGAHAVGRCHTDRSGFSGPWTNSPTVFSNDFFVQLLENKWNKKEWNGPLQYEDPSKKLMMLPADLALVQDPEFKKIVELYAKDEDVFFKDFALAFQKLEELGVKFPQQQKPWWKLW